MGFPLQGSGVGGSSSGSITVADSHVFADTTARDTYFASHASELVDGLYIYITAGTLLQQYDLNTTSWIDRTPVVRGPTGLSGADGKTWLNGSGAPSNSLGVDGDFYIDTTNHVIYGPKATTWPTGVSLIINYTAGDGIDITGTEISVDFIDESGKVLESALPSSITGAVSYKGSFDPASGAPVPAATGYYYVSSGVGTISSIAFATGDWLVYRDGSTWDKIGNSSANVSWANVSDKPSTFTPAAHTQAISTITNLQSALDGKLGTDDTAANSTLWASLAMPSVANAVALQVMRLNADKSAFEFATVNSGGVTDHGELTGLSDDDHPQYIKHSLATALNDVLMASGSGTFVKKTITELKTALGLGDAAYLAVGSTTGTVAAGDHNHSGVYQAISSLLTSIAGLTLTANGGKVIAVKSDVSGFELITLATGGSVATDTIWDAAGDLVVGSGNNTAVRLAMGEALQQLRVNATKTGLEFATINAGDALPTQTGNSGKYLTTDGSNASWATVSAGVSSNSYVISRSIEGVVYETSLMYWVAPATCTISTAIMAVSSNPSATGTYCKVQVMKNGILETNSIFTSDTPMQITEVTSATNGIYQAAGTLDSGQISLAAGDVLHFRVNQSDTGCADLLVQVKVNFT